MSKPAPDEVGYRLDSKIEELLNPDTTFGRFGSSLVLIFVIDIGHTGIIVVEQALGIHSPRVSRRSDEPRGAKICGRESRFIARN